MKKYCLIIISLFCLASNLTAFELFEDRPPETILLELPDKSEKKWKILTYKIKEKDSIIEYIPEDQTGENWSDLICISYIDTTHKGKLIFKSFVDYVRIYALSSYPKNALTWEFIVQNSDNVIYESILHTPYLDRSPNHEIIKLFLTPKAMHTISVMRKNGKMSAEERQKWIDILDKNASVVLMPVAEMVRGLSLANRLKEHKTYL